MRDFSSNENNEYAVIFRVIFRLAMCSSAFCKWTGIPSLHLQTTEFLKVLIDTEISGFASFASDVRK